MQEKLAQISDKVRNSVEGEVIIEVSHIPYNHSISIVNHTTFTMLLPDYKLMCFDVDVVVKGVLMEYREFLNNFFFKTSNDKDKRI